MNSPKSSIRKHFVENQPVTALIDSGCQIPVLNSSLIRVQTPSEEIITLSSCFWRTAYDSPLVSAEMLAAGQRTVRMASYGMQPKARELAQKV
ncbi:hypothetical protein TNCV_1022701 [Trichonephila clavipes]|nr:hypothetical protein TNCV_1022701 [Trichonephila clavipes]